MFKIHTWPNKAGCILTALELVAIGVRRDGATIAIAGGVADSTALSSLVPGSSLIAAFPAAKCPSLCTVNFCWGFTWLNGTLTIENTF